MYNKCTCGRQCTSCPVIYSNPGPNMSISSIIRHACMHVVLINKYIININIIILYINYIIYICNIYMCMYNTICILSLSMSRSMWYSHILRRYIISDMQASTIYSCAFLGALSYTPLCVVVCDISFPYQEPDLNFTLPQSGPRRENFIIAMILPLNIGGPSGGSTGRIIAMIKFSALRREISDLLIEINHRV